MTNAQAIIETTAVLVSEGYPQEQAERMAREIIGAPGFHQQCRQSTSAQFERWYESLYGDDI